MGIMYVKNLAVCSRDLRQEVGMSQQDLAQHIGVSLTTIVKWEAPSKGPLRMYAMYVDKFKAVYKQLTGKEAPIISSKSVKVPRKALGIR